MKSIMSWVWTIVLAFFIAIIINSYVIRASEVFGRSMYPTLEQGDVVFISRMPYIFGKPKHGDIVVFDSTLEKRNFCTEIKESVKYNMITQKFFKTEKSNKYWIKRVIGVPGDVLEIKDGKLYRNGELLEEDYVNSASPITYKNLVPPSMGDGDLTRIVVKEGEIYCMGDNRNHSEDSRAIGPVPINDVLGKEYMEQNNATVLAKKYNKVQKCNILKIGVSQKISKDAGVPRFPRKMHHISKTHISRQRNIDVVKRERNTILGDG